MLFKFIRDRVNERSTWLLVGGSVSAASALPAPWSYISLAVGVVAAFVPDGSVVA